MSNFIEKLMSIPSGVWIGVGIFSVLFFLFVRATDPSKAKKDFKVSKPVKPLSNGSPYIEHTEWRGPARDQEDRLLSKAGQNKQP